MSNVKVGVNLPQSVACDNKYSQSSSHNFSLQKLWKLLSSFFSLFGLWYDSLIAACVHTSFTSFTDKTGFELAITFAAFTIFFFKSDDCLVSPIWYLCAHSMPHDNSILRPIEQEGAGTSKTLSPANDTNAQTPSKHLDYYTVPLHSPNGRQIACR